MKSSSSFASSARGVLSLGILVSLLLSSSNALPAGESFVWATKAWCPLVRFEAVGGAAAGKLFQFSGYYTVGAKILATRECDAYDPVTDKWSSIASIPQAISHCGQVADTDNPNQPIFWLAGGFLGDHPGPSTNEVWKYDIKNNVWSAGPSLPGPRAGGALVKLGRELHYYGGTVRLNGTYVQDYGTHWALDLDGGTAWRTTTKSGQTLAPMPNPRNHMGGIAFKGKLYAVGGQHLGQQDTTAQSEVDVYDPATNTWTQTTPMPRPIGHVTANVFIRNGLIVVTSGAGDNSSKLPNVIEYNPSTETWAELPSLPDGRQSPVSGLVGDRMVVTCGYKGSLHNQTWVEQPSQPPPGQSVVSFTLINADTDQPVPGYEVINNGAIIKTASVGTTNLNVRANTSPAIVGSVRFGLDSNPNAHTESVAPYALFGNSGSDYNAGMFSNGNHTLSGTPFTGKSAQGTAGTALTISFTIQ
jgi:N-acetylneuraminic acid mutarotase